MGTVEGENRKTRTFYQYLRERSDKIAEQNVLSINYNSKIYPKNIPEMAINFQNYNNEEKALQKLDINQI